MTAACNSCRESGSSIPLEERTYYETRAADQLKRYKRIYTVTEQYWKDRLVHVEAGGQHEHRRNHQG